MATRSIVILGLSACLALVLAGCSSGGGSDASSPAATESATASSAAASAASTGGSYTLDEVAAHASAADCWAAINGNVYDLSNWEDQHPGGKDKIVALCGTDATAAFSGQHDSQPKPNDALAQFQIGTLS